MGIGDPLLAFGVTSLPPGLVPIIAVFPAGKDGVKVSVLELTIHEYALGSNRGESMLRDPNPNVSEPIGVNAVALVKGYSSL
jgi:hypothetical protein